MDVQSITGVNVRWVFTEGGGQYASNQELLREIYTAAQLDINFYNRAYSELSAIIDREKEKLQQRHCPTVEEIHALRNAAKSVDLEVKRRYYLQDSFKISGMYDILSDVFKKRAHAEKIAHQVRIVMEG